MKYTLEYLPIARQDMIDIARYIGVKLSNQDAANRLAEKMIEAAEELCDMPYRCSVYTPPRPLRYEYRKLIVQNYIMFYRVDEDKKLITVARVIYAGREHERLL